MASLEIHSLKPRFEIRDVVGSTLDLQPGAAFQQVERVRWPREGARKLRGRHHAIAHLEPESVAEAEPCSLTKGGRRFMPRAT